MTKSLDQFHRSNRATGARAARKGFGVQASCKQCHSEAWRPGITSERERAAQLLALGMKLCSVCRIEKSLSDFSKRRASSNGVSFKCRECSKAYIDQWREVNPEAHKLWYAKNRGKRSEDYRKWRSVNKEHLKLSIAQWAKSNKHIVNALIARRRGAKINARVAWANEDEIRKIYAEAARLTMETGIKYEVDHIYPLQGELVCGLHCEANLQVITKTENIRKGNKMPDF